MSQPQVQTQTVVVQILDKEYPVVCPVQERANLERAAAYLDGKMREIRRSGKVVGAERIAVLAALNITHELQDRQRSMDLHNSTSSEQMANMLRLLDQALAND